MLVSPRHLRNTSIHSSLVSRCLYRRGQADSAAEIASQDAVYVLAYSVIMLNTDLHNPQNRVSQRGGIDGRTDEQKRMTIDDYKKNLRGVNEGKDFPPEYLVSRKSGFQSRADVQANIHDSLRRSEIILPEEHAGQHGFDYAWKSLMQRSRTAGESMHVRP